MKDQGVLLYFLISILTPLQPTSLIYECGGGYKDQRVSIRNRISRRASLTASPMSSL